MKDFWSAFNDADTLLVIDIFPAGERPIDTVHAKDIVKGVCDYGHKNTIYIKSKTDYQDFELPLSDEPTLIAKICQYVGIEIREADVYNFGTQELQQEQQTQG